MSYGPTRLASRVPRGSPRTLWPSYQESGDVNFIGEHAAVAELAPHEQVLALDNLDLAKNHRGAMCDALVLPDHDLNHKTRPGHAPAGPYGEFGPRQPSKGGRIGDHLGTTHQTLNVRTAAKNLQECLKYIDLGHDVNDTFTASRNGDTMGWTTMHFAAKWDRVDVIECLLHHGADPLMRTWEGETALVLARKRGNWAAYRLLETFIKTGRCDQHGVVSPYKPPSNVARDEMDLLDAKQISSPQRVVPPANSRQLNDDDDPEMQEKPRPRPTAWLDNDDDLEDLPEDFMR